MDSQSKGVYVPHSIVQLIMNLPEAEAQKIMDILGRKAGVVKRG